VEPLLLGSNDAMALLLFMLVLPVFTFLFSPLSSLSSRKHEFEADAFAASIPMRRTWSRRWSSCTRTTPPP
jgi:Zn-dependent protease with chaperone function